jgi:3-oxoacyl-[acyl-carrier-protein] synthase II
MALFKSKRRVVVTGLGTINPCGDSVEATWSALLNGESGISHITHFDPEGFPSRIAGQVKGFDPKEHFGAETKKMDPFIQYAAYAAKAAMKDAGLDQPNALTEDELDRFGVILGSGIGGLTTISEHAVMYAHIIGEPGTADSRKAHERTLVGLAQEQLQPVDRAPLSTDKHPVDKTRPNFIPKLIICNASGYVSVMFDLRGPNSSIATACAAGTHAIGDAARQIMHGYADRMITGGSVAVITPLGPGGFGAMHALADGWNDEPEKASRPFDTKRGGFIIAEGAAILVLEEYEAAKARGAHIYGEILGYGMSGDAHSMYDPHPTGNGAARAMKLALEDAGLAPGDVDYINAHGTSTPAGDRAESLAICKVFGENASHLFVSSTKSVTGHLVGAAGALEMLVCTKVVETGDVPPTINVDELDPECKINLLTEPSQLGCRKRRIAMNNSFGFGGANACLIISSM